MISVSNLAKSFGPQTLFSGVAFQLNIGERYGLVGANGSGKSTLLKVLTGDELPSEGTVSIAKKLNLGVLKQDHFAYESERILDVVLMGNEELWSATTEKDELLARADDSFDAERYTELEEIVLKHDGYTAESRAGEVLEGLGLAAEIHDQPLSTLSGGFKLRVLLAQTLASGPDALLLDEPTNHLDIISIRWLEKFLQEYTGVAVVISHDHRFLDNVCTSILDVDYETVGLYRGNYTAFMQQKAEERTRKQKEIGKREKEIAHHEAFVTRFRAKATKARQAQSKLRLIEKRRNEIEPLAPSSRRYPKFKFGQTRPSGREALTLEDISKAYGDNQVLSEVSLTVQRGDRVAIIGPNGIGKSTLLKIAVGDVEADAGEVTWGYEARHGYFPQDHNELLQPEREKLEGWLWHTCPGEPIGFVRGHLAQVLFSGDDVEKRIGSLSGGEAARAIFARLAVAQPNVMILDEPTNHLDLEAIEALVEGLAKYEGTLIFVSCSNGIVFTPDRSARDRDRFDALFVCGGLNVHRTEHDGAVNWLRQLVKQKMVLGALCTGSYLLAKADLLDGYRCTIHWENIASAREQYPHLVISPELFEIDRDRYTCAGGIAPMDMMLFEIRQKHGTQLATSISEQFMCERIRDQHDRQRVPLTQRIGTSQPKLAEAVSLMEANIEEPMTLDELSFHVGLSRRQLERLFQRYLSCVPTRYYLELRLERARQLLLQTSMPIVDIALACGFISAPHFSKCYRDTFSLPPRDERRRAAGLLDSQPLENSGVRAVGSRRKI